MSLQDIMMQRAMIQFQNEQGGAFTGIGPSTIFSDIASKVVKRIDEQREYDRQLLKEKLSREQALKDQVASDNRRTRIISELSNQYNDGYSQEITVNNFGEVSTKFKPIKGQQVDNFEQRELLRMRSDLAKKGERVIPKDLSEAYSLMARQADEEEALRERKIAVDENNLIERRRTQKRLEVNAAINSMASRGARFDINDEDVADMLSSRNIPIDDLIESGKATRNIEDGTVSVKSQKAMDEIDKRTEVIPDGVSQYIAETKKTRDVISDSVKEFIDLGLDKENIDNSVWQQLFSETGPLSIKAKSELLIRLGANSGDERKERIAALFNKLERAFQLYRVETTGVQASDKELKSLRPLIFNLTQGSGQFLRNAKDILRELDQSVSGRLGVMSSMGKRGDILNNMKDFYLGSSEPFSNFDIYNYDSSENIKFNDSSNSQIIQKYGEENITATMNKYNMSREQVIKKLREMEQQGAK